MNSTHIVIIAVSVASVFGIFLLGKLFDRCGVEKGGAQ